MAPCARSTMAAPHRPARRRSRRFATQAMSCPPRAMLGPRSERPAPMSPWLPRSTVPRRGACAWRRPSLASRSAPRAGRVQHAGLDPLSVAARCDERAPPESRGAGQRAALRSRPISSGVVATGVRWGRAYPARGARRRCAEHDAGAGPPRGAALRGEHGWGVGSSCRASSGGVSSCWRRVRCRGLGGRWRRWLS